MKCLRVWLFGISLLCIASVSLSVENFLVTPATSKKKTISKAALADEVEVAIRDLIASCNRTMQDACRVQEYYLNTACALIDGDVAVEKDDLSRLLAELQRVQSECGTIERSFATIKQDVAKSKKTAALQAEPLHKKGA